jgi:predicted negative regulator of RcsB-dependent stress response
VESEAAVTWWAALLAVAIPLAVSGPIGWLTWRTLNRGQATKSALELAQAGQVGVGTMADLIGQVEALWKERASVREKLDKALAALSAARAELNAARLELAAATNEVGRLRLDLARASERIVLLEREVVRLGGDPAAIGQGGTAHT